MAAASGSPTAALLAAIAWQGQQDFAATAAPIGVCRGRECGNQQPSHVISSSLHVMHAAHANGAYQQAAAASTVRVASGDGGRERHAGAPVATGATRIDASPTPVGMAAASANQQQLLWLPSNGRCLQSRSSLPRPIGACRGRECGNQQPTHVVSSSPHVVHAMPGSARLS